MQKKVKVVVIGGGVVGCSVIYHLTKFGWSDVMLIERSELTSGSTWHAAGGFHTLNGDTNMAALQGYTIRLYQELEEVSGQSCGLHHVGGLTLAETPERLDFLKAEQAKHRYMGLDTRIVSPSEIPEISPITNPEGILGALYDPLDGHLDPSGTTHAYAAAARKQGAEIVLRNSVIAINPVRQADGKTGWVVETERGEVHAEHVVIAAGLWAREVGRLAGVELPLHPMEHQYLVTDDLPEVFERTDELPHVMDPAGESYLRQEGRGLVIGFYEQACDPWAVNGTPADFGHELLPDKLERIGDALELAYRRYPVLESAGIKKIINGPFTFAPDGNPLVGPLPGKPGLWSACAVMAGFSQGGGVGRTLAEWMVEGEPQVDVFAMDVARFGDYATGDWTREKVVENYQRRFSVSFPNEELPVGRPLVTTPAYDIWNEQNAVFGSGYGLEHVNYFAASGEPRFELPSFRRSNAFDAIGRECAAVRTAVGINEVHNFAKYAVSGTGARKWLDRILAGRIPLPGKIALNPMLANSGKLFGDFTVTGLPGDHAEECFLLTASYSAQAFHMRWFQQHLPHDGSVVIDNVSDRRIGFQIAGPRANAVLQACTDVDVSLEALKFLSAINIELRAPDGEGAILNALVQRVTYTGDLGYEIYVNADQQLALYRILETAGAAHEMQPFGMRAMMSLRLEKSFGSWMREYKPDYTPLETGLSRFVHYDKPDDFIGRSAAIAERETGASRMLCTFKVDAVDADPWGDEPIWHDNKVVGFVTSGGFAHFSQTSVAFGFLPLELVQEGRRVEIELLGERVAAELYQQPLLDQKRQS